MIVFVFVVFPKPEPFRVCINSVCGVFSFSVAYANRLVFPLTLVVYFFIFISSDLLLLLIFHAQRKYIKSKGEKKMTQKERERAATIDRDTVS